MTSATAKAELTINARVSPELLPRDDVEKNNEKTREEKKDDDDDDKDDERKKKKDKFLMCKIEIELSTYTIVRDLQVYVDVDEPLAVTNDTLELDTLCWFFFFFLSLKLKNKIIIK